MCVQKEEEEESGQRRRKRTTRARVQKRRGGDTRTPLLRSRLSVRIANRLRNRPCSLISTQLLYAIDSGRFFSRMTARTNFLRSSHIATQLWRHANGEKEKHQQNIETRTERERELQAAAVAVHARE